MTLGALFLGLLAAAILVTWLGSIAAAVLDVVDAAKRRRRR